MVSKNTIKVLTSWLSVDEDKPIVTELYVYNQKDDGKVPAPSSKHMTSGNHLDLFHSCVNY